MKIRTSVLPSGEFIYGIHKPQFAVQNFRETDGIDLIGFFPDGSRFKSGLNFPTGDVEELQADWIYEIPNPFPFRGTTFITRSRADHKATDPTAISLPRKEHLSLSNVINDWIKDGDIRGKTIDKIFNTLPEPLLIALAANSTDPDDLIRLANLSCKMVYDSQGKLPKALAYVKESNGRIKADIKNRLLFEAVANNIFLPDAYKNVMVLKPGVQGNSEIVGEWLNKEESSHVFEYLRRNSYIPWGHYAANMANDSVRYSIKDLTMEDITGMRHLYYQRTYVRTAAQLGIAPAVNRKRLSVLEMEGLRSRIQDALFSEKKRSALEFNCTLWGWNFGFDYTPSKYRLHASHQQVHQQFALIPAVISATCGKIIPFNYGDLISAFVFDYRKETGKNFFDCYIEAIRTNRRMDCDKSGERRSLVVYEDSHVMLFVPKAQTSQWELNIMTKDNIGNILEADTDARKAIDRAMLVSVKVLSAMGARMITTIESSKRFDTKDTDQRLLYFFLPKLPESPGAFSEAQLRWINGHYPEDFAAACRAKLPEAMQNL